MANNCFSLIADNRITEAELSVNRPTVSSAYGLDNIKHYDRSMTAKWTAGGDIEILINWPNKPVRFDSAMFVGLVMSIYGSASFTGYYGQNQTGDVLFYSGSQSTGGYKAPLDIDWGIDPYGVKYDSAKDRVNILAENSSIIQSAKIVISDPGYDVELRHLIIGTRTYFDRSYLLNSATFSHRRGGEISRVASGFGARGQAGKNVREFGINLGAMTPTDFARFMKLEEQFGDNAWFIFGRPWEVGSIREKHEFLSIMDTANFTSTGYRQWGTQRLFIEV